MASILREHASPSLNLCINNWSEYEEIKPSIEFLSALVKLQKILLVKQLTIITNAATNKDRGKAYCGSTMLSFLLICANISHFNYKRSNQSCFIPEVSPPNIPVVICIEIFFYRSCFFYFSVNKLYLGNNF